LVLQHPAQLLGPVDTHVLPGSDGDGDGVPPPPLPPLTLTNFHCCSPDPSSFSTSFRWRALQSELALRYLRHPAGFSWLMMLKHLPSVPLAGLTVHWPGYLCKCTRSAQAVPLQASFFSE